MIARARAQEKVDVQHQIKITPSIPSTPSKSLAEELFPPSPPSPLSETKSIVSNSESDSESAPRMTESMSWKVGLAKLNESFKMENQMIPETIFISSDEEEDVAVSRERVREGGRRSQVFSLESDSDSMRGHHSRVASKGLEADRRKRRVTIEVIDSSSEDGSDCEIVRKLLVPAEINSIPVEKIIVPDVELEEVDCTCVDDDEEDIRMGMVSNLITHEMVEEVDDFFDEEIDPNAGVLTYEPTPFSNRPTPRKSNILEVDQNMSPSIKQNVKKVLPTRKIIDLTRDSDSETDQPIVCSILAPSEPLTDKVIFEIPSLPRARKPLYPSVSEAISTPSKRNSTDLSTPSTPLTSSKPKSKIDKAPIPKSHRKPISKSGLSIELREALSLALIKELDQKVFRKKWEGMKIVEGVGIGLPDGIKIVWNNRLRNTAGRANWKKVTTATGIKIDETFIELSIKVIDSPEKLRLTLAHELVHVAAWIISREIKPDHGPAFKLWYVISIP